MSTESKVGIGMGWLEGRDMRERVTSDEAIKVYHDLMEEVGKSRVGNHRQRYRRERKEAYSRRRQSNNYYMFDN